MVGGQLDNPIIVFDTASTYVMAVDLDAMTVEMTEFQVETGFVDHVASVTHLAAGMIELPVALSLNGFFDALMPRGPYPVESRGLSFSAAGVVEAASDETFRIMGAAAMDEGKFDVNLTLDALEFELMAQALTIRAIRIVRCDGHGWAVPLDPSRGRSSVATTIKACSELYVTSVWSGRPALYGKNCQRRACDLVRQADVSGFNSPFCQAACTTQAACCMMGRSMMEEHEY